MALDPCLEGCLNHNMGANTVPTAADDPCNSGGNGYFCPGSYWSYDPTAVGADPDTDGDCPRLFFRYGEDCNVDQWLEIAIAEMITDTVPPVDGDDCCPPGTLWSDTTGGGMYISTNNNGDCTWCEICAPGADDTHTSVEAWAASDQWIQDTAGGALPAGTVANLVPATASITNPSATRTMAVQIVWQGYGANYSFQRSAPGLTFNYTIQPNFYLNGILLNNPAGGDALFALSNTNATTVEDDKPTSGWTITTLLAPGGTLTASMDATYIEQLAHNADLNSRVSITPATVSILGTTI